MNIDFADKKMRKYARSEKLAKKELGEQRAGIFFKRLSAIHAADNMEVLRPLPGHYHELTQNRKGQWACDLDQPYRLIIAPAEKPPFDEKGNCRWDLVKSVNVVEIVNYHKEK